MLLPPVTVGLPIDVHMRRIGTPECSIGRASVSHLPRDLEGMVGRGTAAGRKTWYLFSPSAAGLATRTTSSFRGARPGR
jgi:hypothetical protein